MVNVEIGGQVLSEVEKAKARLFSARQELLPIRNDFIIANFWLLFAPLTPDQKLVIFDAFFRNQYKDEIAMTRKDIGPPKKILGDSLTNFDVEKGVFKAAGDFSLNLLSQSLGKPGTEKQRRFYRQFGEETVKPHIVLTKVIQRQESRVKGNYSRRDNRAHIILFTKLIKERLAREEKERKERSLGKD